MNQLDHIYPTGTITDEHVWASDVTTPEYSEQFEHYFDDTCRTPNMIEAVKLNHPNMANFNESHEDKELADLVHQRKDSERIEVTLDEL
ncbi:hypothetical protein [Vibrio harveyi]|uniref:hypothetical protein n=1 Tax=Vibrio harveyi TaxID=669 RepID=UPI00390B9546